MRHMRTVTLFLPLLALLILSGCVKYDDAIEIDQNGRGTVTIVVSRPTLGALDKLKNRVYDVAFSEAEMTQGLPSGVKPTYTVTEKDKRKEFTIVYAFEDINTLIGWAAKKPVHPLRDVSVVRKDNVLEFTRSFHPDSDAIDDAKKFFPDTVFTFRLKGPGKIEAQNATRIENGVLVWEIKPASLDASGRDLKAAFYFGTPLWMYAMMALAIAGPVIVALIFVWRKKRSPAA